jgi:intein-encoded DNA endonuclease-like protein
VVNTLKIQPYTDEEIEILRKYYATAPKELLLALLPNRSWSSITVKASKLGLSRRRTRNAFIPVFNEDLAYILGVYYGDGSVFEVKRKHKGNRGVEKVFEVDAGKDERAFAESVREALERLGLHAYIADHGNTWRVVCYSSTLVDFLKNLNFESCKRWLDSDDRYFYTFVRGLYESEGSICKPRKLTCKRKGVGWRSRVQLRIYNTNKELLDFVAEGLNRRGIKAKIYKFKRKNGFSSAKEMFMIVISGVRHISRFLEAVKPITKNNPW